MLKSEAKLHFKSFIAIAKALNISKSAVSQWPLLIPRGAAFELQVITGGALQVRPELYGRRKHTPAYLKSGAAA